MSLDRLPRCIHDLISCSVCGNHPSPPTVAEREVAVREWDAHRAPHVSYPVAHQEPVEAPGYVPAAIAIDGTADNLHDYVTELCERTVQSTEYPTWTRDQDGNRVVENRIHRVTEISLIEQLQSAAPSSGAETGGAFGSRPAARLDVVAVLATITRGDTQVGVAGVYPWLDALHAPETPKHLPDAIRHLRSLAPRLRRCGHRKGRYWDETETWCCDWHHLEHDIAIWWTQARVATGWESPAYKLNNTCPVCSDRGGLRIRIQPDTAVCVNCRATWPPELIGLLAEHVRAENHDPAESEAAS